MKICFSCDDYLEVSLYVPIDFFYLFITTYQIVKVPVVEVLTEQATHVPDIKLWLWPIIIHSLTQGTFQL